MEEALGEIIASMNGEDRIWYTLYDSESGGGSNTGFDDFGVLRAVNLQGYPENRDGLMEVLSISISVAPESNDVLEARIMFVPERMARAYVSDEDDMSELVLIEELELEEEGGFITGTFAAELCFKDGMFANPDPEDCIVLEGRFHTELVRNG